MNKVVIGYPGVPERFWENLDYTLHSPGTVTLREHSTFIPLAPGDLVNVDPSMRVTGVHTLAKLYTVEVGFHLPADLQPFKSPDPDHRALRAIRQLVARWKRDAWVTQTTNFTALVSSESKAWLWDMVKGHKYIEEFELIRTPETQINFQVAVQHPDLDGTRKGPFA